MSQMSNIYSMVSKRCFKILSLSLAFSMMTANLSAISVNAINMALNDKYELMNTSSEMVFVSDDFQNEDISMLGQVPSGWYFTPSSFNPDTQTRGTTTTLQKAPEHAAVGFESANKVLDFARQYINGSVVPGGLSVVASDVRRYASVNRDRIDGDIKVSFDLKSTAENVFEVGLYYAEFDQIVFFKFAKNYEVKYSTQVYSAGSGAYTVTDYTLPYTYPANEWFNMRVETNVNNRTFKVYFDNQPVSTGPMNFYYMNPADSKYGRTQLQEIYIRSDRNASYVGSHIYIDNVKVYKDYTEELTDALEFLMDEDVSNEPLDAITASLTLPNSIQGYPVTWKSSDETIINNSGSIARRAYTQNVQLTATMRGPTDARAIQNPSLDKPFDITILPRNGATEEEKVNEYIANCLKNSTITSEPLNQITSSLNTLTVNGPDGITIDWSSDKPYVISDSGVVSRPGYGGQEEEVRLTATVKLGSYVKDVVFILTVIPEIPVEEMILRAMNAITYMTLTEENKDAITTHLKLPSKGLYDTNISWSSNNEQVISSDGVVVRADTVKTVTVTATFELDGRYNSKDFIFTVQMSNMAMAKHDLDLLNLGDLSAVTDDFKVRTTGEAYGSMIQWSSDNSAISFILGDAVVTRPLYTQNDANVVITARATCNGALATKTFNATVITMPSDEQAVDSAYNWLTFDKISQENIDSVTQNLSMSTQFQNGVTGTWTSTNVKIISKTGLVTRPNVGGSDAVAIITVTLTKGSVSREKPFTVTVKAFDEADKVIQKAVEELNFNVISTEPITMVSSDLALPVNWNYGTTIVWMSGNESLIKIEDSQEEDYVIGKVLRPVFGTGVKSVLLTAIISYGELSLEKQFNIAIVEESKDVSFWWEDFETFGAGTFTGFKTGTYDLPTMADVDIVTDPDPDAQNQSNKVMRIRRTSLSSASGSGYFRFSPTEGTSNHEKTGDIIINYKLFIDENVNRRISLEGGTTTGTEISVHINEAKQLLCSLDGGVSLINTAKTVPYGSWADFRIELNTYDRFYNVYINGECYTNRGEIYTASGERYNLDDGIPFYYKKGANPTKFTGLRLSCGTSAITSDLMIYVDDMNLMWKQNYSREVRAACDDFETKFLSAQNTFEITSSLILPGFIANGASVAFSSDKPNVIGSNGSVTRGESDQIVNFTATFTYGTEVMKRTFVIIVKNKNFVSQSPGGSGDGDDVEAVLSDLNWAANQLKSSCNINMITGNLSFPLSGPKGSKISWLSGNKRVIANDGTVTRPDVNTTLTLTITAGRNGVSDSDILQATVKAKDSPSYSGGGTGGGGGSTGGIPAGSTVLSPVSEIGNTDVEIQKDIIFKDVPDDFWGKEAIEFLYQRNIIAGRNTDSFEPNNEISREEFTKIAILSVGFELESGDSHFKDVISDEWYYPYIVTAYNKGIINGQSADTFGIFASITRQDMCVIVYNALKKKAISFNEEQLFESFSDHDYISDYAREAVYYLRNTGIVNGKGNMSFEPEGLTTRAEASQILYKVITKIGGKVS